LPLTKYHQIYVVLREQLMDGQFSGGLPGELALMQQFKVARVTVRRALELLAAEGLIAREPGRGTRTLAVARAHAPLTGLLGNIVRMGLKTSVTVLEIDMVTASANVANALQLNAGDSVQKAVRARRTQEGPISHITTYVPAGIGRHFGRDELAKTPILVLMEAAGVKVGRAHQTISARLADVLVAKHLEVAVGSALLAVRRLVYDDQDRPVQWLHGLYRPDRYEYEMELSRVGSIDAKVWVNEEI
jgi:GntR family transcriptional regulator